MQTADSRRRTEEAGRSSRAGPTTAPPSRGMREEELIPEVVEDNGQRWGEDEPEACQLHRIIYTFLERHIMGITAAQFVWEPEGETEEATSGPDPHESSTPSAAPPPEDSHHPPEGEGCTTTTGTRKRIRRKTAPSEAGDEQH